VFEVRGDQPLEDVWQETQAIMNSFIANDVLMANTQLLEAIASEDLDLYRSLCAGEMFSELPAHEVMVEQEGRGEFPVVDVARAELNFITGTKVSVSYDRLSGTETFRETRVWSHQGLGWRMIHFSRTPSQLSHQT
jgi:hypothetical protein